MARKKNSDEVVVQLQKEIERRKSELGSVEKNSHKTNMTFSFSEKAADSINVNTITSVESLVKIYSSLKMMKEQYDNAVADLGVEDAPGFKWMGFSFEDWAFDLKNRITKLQLEKKKAKLAALEARVNSLMSTELKTRLELDKIMDELKV